MKIKAGYFCRILCVALSLLMIGSLLVSCSGNSEIPDGYQYATCKGEYFRLFIPTQWTVNTESGVSGGFYSHRDEATVTMTEMFPEGISELEDFYADHVAQVSKLKNYQLDKEFNTTQSGYRAKEIYYSAKISDRNVKLRQILTKVAGRFYLFTYSANADVFEQWLDIVDDILLNITFQSFPYDGEHDRKVPSDITPPDGMKLVSDNEVAYRFYAPVSWIWESNVGQNLVYASETDKSNVSVVSYALQDDTMTVEDYWVQCRDAYMAALENFTLLNIQEGTAETTTETSAETSAEITPAQGEASTMGGKHARVYEFTYTLGGVEYHVRQVIAKHSAMMYTMTYTALPENYETHLADAVAMQEALTFRGMFD